VCSVDHQEIPGAAWDGIKRAIEMEQLRHFVAASSKALGLSVAFLMVTVSGAMASLATPWQLGTQDPVSPVAERIVEFHEYLLWLITIITLFVLVLMIYVCIRFKASNNPTPSRTTHNTLIEILWTAVPVLILVIVAVPSFKTLYYGDRTFDPDMTIKVTANQWYWTYEYPDQGLSFDSYMIPKEEIDPKTQTYLLSVDNPLVVPVGKKIQILVTSNDVMHSFFLPSAVVQIYGMLGRINETWMQIDKEGTVFGQCNQICGINHSAMPIAVTALSQEKYDAWLAEAKVKFAAAPAPIRVADGAVNE
jgi:cytochrome c oxidase subunit II